MDGLLSIASAGEDRAVAVVAARVEEEIAARVDSRIAAEREEAATAAVAAYVGPMPPEEVPPLHVLAARARTIAAQEMLDNPAVADEVFDDDPDEANEEHRVAVMPLKPKAAVQNCIRPLDTRQRQTTIRHGDWTSPNY